MFSHARTPMTETKARDGFGADGDRTVEPAASHLVQPKGHTAMPLSASDADGGDFTLCLLSLIKLSDCNKPADETELLEATAYSQVASEPKGHTSRRHDGHDFIPISYILRIRDRTYYTP